MTAVSNDAYRQTLRELSDRVVEAQRAIRVLDAVKWDSTIRERFFADNAQVLPAIDAEYYRSRPLSFDCAAKRTQFLQLERDIVRKLGEFNPVGKILRRMCREYHTVVRLIEARGTPEFTLLSQELYGAASDAFYAGDPTLADMGNLMLDVIENLADSPLMKEQERDIDAEHAVTILQEKMRAAFADSENSVRVKLSDGIVADAAAGADYLKIRADATFNERDLRILEVHEGWVHLGTTLNGARQSVCTFLSKGPPSSTITQEGLAIVMEIISLASYPWRVRRLTHRTRAVDMVENGATFIDVYRFYLEQQYGEREAYGNATRVFRGSTPTGGAFTKDLAYSKGFILIYNFLRLAVRKGKPERIPLLFCGKTRLEDLGLIAQLVEEGIVEKPAFLPPPFRDLNAIASWMCYSNFLNKLNLQRIEADYAGIL